MYKHFHVKELVPSSIYYEFREDSKWFVDDRIVCAADNIREFFDQPMWINNYNWGLENRGFRSPTTTVGASLSQHKFGRAIDFHLSNIDTRKAYNKLLDNEDKLLNWGITTLENIDFTYDENSENKGWIHADCRQTNKDSILIVNP